MHPELHTCARAADSARERERESERVREGERETERGVGGGKDRDSPVSHVKSMDQ